MIKQLAAFVDNIRRLGLLSSDKIGQITVWSETPNADPQQIARDIVQRGWLTAFQVKMIWKGHAAELLLNQYILMDRLGEGGMGEVFKARHRRMERDVALKVIRKEKLGSPEAVKRFHQEIQTAAQLSHENVVMAYDADQDGERHFFAMELVEGTNLAKLVKEKGPMEIGLACDCIRQAALGLQHACERGMVHRDIKPSNLLLGKNGVVKILDMGLARLEESPSGEDASRITKEGLVIGTPDFLAPEQARDARTVDTRADIYALGCSFYYLLCGHAPYQGGTPTEKLLRQTTDPIPALTRPGVPPGVEAIIYRMMAKKPEERFQLPAEVAGALLPFTGRAMPSSSARNVRPALGMDMPGYSPPSTAVLAATVPDEPRTESQFRLPPPKPLQSLPPEPTRRYVLIAVAISIVVLGLAALAVVLFVFRGDEPPASSLDKEIRNRHEMVMMLVPAGSFDMGSPEAESGRGKEEGPVHRVEITHPFYMAATEVTLKQYKSVVGQLPNAYQRLKAEPEDLDVAAGMVSWGEAGSFCKKLNADASSKKEGKEGWEYRLPTEAEWEYACRAGTRTRYSFGDSLSREQAAFGDPAAKAPGKPRQFPANAWGLYDMHGNAAEWVADQYDADFYKESPLQDPTGPKSFARFVIRGGSIIEDADACRSARRLGRYPEMPKDKSDLETARHIGFRVVMAPVSK